MDSKEKQVIITKEVKVLEKVATAPIEQTKIHEEEIADTSHQMVEEKPVKKSTKKHTLENQLDLFGVSASEEIVQTLRDLDIMHTTPFEALELLYALQKKVR